MTCSNNDSVEVVAVLQLVPTAIDDDGRTMMAKIELNEIGPRTCSDSRSKQRLITSKIM
jgi:hypothetical protein